ncbi:MAG: hypothetical protein KDA75_07410 [Planctomycetaceae bacterium]|nr:hypothetical protein [Planctomycetaceae bacterium]
MRRSLGTWLCCGATLVCLGCGGSTTPEPSAAEIRTPSEAGKKLLLAEAPTGAVDVKAAREQAAADQEIVVVGRIGGSVDPWVDGMAAFTIVDRSLKACSDIPGDKCPTPWDYCCESDVGQARTLVKFVGEQGEVITTHAQELLGVSELQTVYVQGKAQRDADGNLSLVASRIYVQPGTGAVHLHEDAGHNHAHEHHHDHDHSDASAAPAETSEAKPSTDPDATAQP